MKNLLEEQLQRESDYYEIGKDFQKTKLRGNIKARKRKLFDELNKLIEIEELSSILQQYQLIEVKKLGLHKNFFIK